MKKIYITLVAVLAITQLAFGQWTTGTNISNTNSGNVSIGTTVANEKLTVNGAVAAFGQVVSPMANTTYLDYCSGCSASRFLATGPNNSTYGVIKFANATANTAGYRESLTILGNGNVGVGTTSPGSNLTIRGTGSGVSIHAIGSGYFGSIAFNREVATGVIFDPAGSAFQINNGGTDANLHFQVYNGFGSVIAENALVIAGSNGNIGIGTATPDAKLAVNGSIHTQEVKVDMIGWSDYVFEPTYKLPSLSEIKTYIDQNQHLPEIPSEQEVVKNGLNLGEMNKLLLKKVEELTLYLIEKDNETKVLKASKENQQNQLDQLKKQLEALTKEIHKTKSPKHISQ